MSLENIPCGDGTPRTGDNPQGIDLAGDVGSIECGSANGAPHFVWNFTKTFSSSVLPKKTESSLHVKRSVARYVQEPLVVPESSDDRNRVRYLAWMYCNVVEAQAINQILL